MAKIRKSAKADISALLSKHVVVKNFRNQTVISTVTVPRKSKSAKKEASNHRFATAGDWARATLMKPGMKALYSKGINSKLTNARTVAVTDFLTAPKIHYVSLKQYTDAIGDKIRIKATDDFQVTSVKVTIRDNNGKTLEKGPAFQYKRKPVMWVYTLTVANPYVVGTVVEVMAKDRPGNAVVKTETIVCNL